MYLARLCVMACLAAPCVAGAQTPAGSDARTASGVVTQTTSRAVAPTRSRVVIEHSPGIATRTPLAMSCGGCHQPSVDAPEMPALDRLSAAHVGAALRRARDAPQAGSIMARFAVHWSDAEIDSLARQLAKPTP